MLGSSILEVAIGIIFIFILVSTICSAIREGIEAWLKTRAAYLEHGIRELLKDNDGSGLAKHLYEHPLVFGLFSGPYTPGSNANKPRILANGRMLPSYIPAKNFATALMDIAARGPETDDVSSSPESPIISLDTIRMNVLNFDNKFVQRAVLTAIDSAQGDFNKAQKNIEAWYDSGMDRVSGWYRRSTQWILFWIALVVAVALNINTITIANYLYHNDAARSVIVSRAEEAAKDSSGLDYNKARSAIDSLNLPIGWTTGWSASNRQADQGNQHKFEIWNDLLVHFLGLLLTAFAAMLGAPFWFDILNKVMVIRSTVKPHEKSKEEESEDRQAPSSNVLPVVTEGQNQPSRQSSPPDADSLTSSIQNIRDRDSSVDGCEVDMNDPNNITNDEQLPPAEGGVA